ncbi:branched-chain amino acid ABC transporter permease [Candidatus Acetothermia bacterium]|nr:branched-chain amino acid ABC transporter permease [Candidatus Acetothermia bacterium]
MQQSQTANAPLLAGIRLKWAIGLAILVLLAVLIALGIAVSDGFRKWLTDSIDTLQTQGLQSLFNGIRYGCILLLGAIGLSLTYKILNFGNFSHGDVMAIGVAIAISLNDLARGFLTSSLPDLEPSLREIYGLAFAFVGTVLITPWVAIAVDRILYKRFRKAKPVVLIIASFGMALILRSLVQVIWGTQNQGFGQHISVTPPLSLGYIGDKEIIVRISNQDWLIIGAAIVLTLLLHFFLKYSKLGKAMRAMADNTDLARSTGIDTERVIFWTWWIGGALAAAGGFFLCLVFGPFRLFNVGPQVVLPLFAATILGGIGSPYGAMAGGLLIGLAQNVLVLFIPGQYNPTAWQPAVAFALLIIMLLIRPQGILGSGK